MHSFKSSIAALVLSIFAIEGAAQAASCVVSVPTFKECSSRSEANCTKDTTLGAVPYNGKTQVHKVSCELKKYPWSDKANCQVGENKMLTSDASSDCKKSTTSALCSNKPFCKWK